MAGLLLRSRVPLPTHPALAPDALQIHRARLRHVLNWVNLATPLGMVVAKLGGARLRRGPGRSYLGDYYRWGFPTGSAFTIGDVVISRHDLDLLAKIRPGLIEHELVHSQQWAYCLGLPFLPLYVASMGWSWLRTGDRAARSIFERQAGLALGGYPDVAPRPLGPVIGEGARQLASWVGIGRKGLDAGERLGSDTHDDTRW